MSCTVLYQSLHAYTSWSHVQELLAPPPLASSASTGQQSCHPWHCVLSSVYSIFTEVGVTRSILMRSIATRSTPMRSTCREINSQEINLLQDQLNVLMFCFMGQEHPWANTKTFWPCWSVFDLVELGITSSIPHSMWFSSLQQYLTTVGKIP